MTTYEVFKYVTIRAPEKATSKSEEKRFIVDKRPINDSVILKMVDKSVKVGDDLDTLISNTESLIRDNNYTNTYPSGQDADKFEKLVEIMEKNMIQYNLIDDIENIIVSLTDFVNTENFAEIRDGLWDRLYAFYILRYQQVQNIDPIMRNLRVTHVLEYLAANNAVTFEDYREIYSSVPILPDILAKLGGEKQMKTQRIRRVDVLDEETISNFIDITRAINEISVHELNLKALPGNSKKKDLTSGAPVISTDDRPLGRSIDHKVRVLDVDVIEKFTPKTKLLLEAREIDLTKKDFSESLNMLKYSRRLLINRIIPQLDEGTIRLLLNNRKDANYLESLLKSKLIESRIVLEKLEDIFPSVGKIKPLGIGDLKVVKQTLEKYTEGEIAHIENVLKGESKERKHRRLDRIEESTLMETETTEESEKDLQSTERFELQRESETTIKEDTNLKAGLTVTASYGAVTTTANADFAYTGSRTDAMHSSTRYAKEIVSRSLEKIQKRVREERVLKRISEVEEINTHGLENKTGNAHITGIYRWVDKHYTAQIFNYGARLMFEFIVPEPAAFYIYSLENKPRILIPELPLDPTSFGPDSIGDGEDFALDTCIKNYRLQNIPPMPPAEMILSIAFAEKGDPNISVNANKMMTRSTTELKVPNGYEADHCYIAYDTVGGNGTLRVAVGRNQFTLNPGTVATDVDREMNKENEVIPVSLFCWSNDIYICNVEILCTRIHELYKTWQRKIYDLILVAYKALKEAYDNKIAEESVPLGINIRGKNPQINREIEKQELKRLCINILTNQNFSSFGSLTDDSTSGPTSRYPEIEIQKARRQGNYIQFFEQAFEWENITYLFYPYFWGRKSKWVKNLNIDDTDPLFTRFLQAGAARVLVPAPLEYQEAILAYLKNPRIIWNGGPTPTIEDPLYRSIIHELRSEQDPFRGAVPEGDPWPVIIPTSLVYLQPDFRLNP